MKRKHWLRAAKPMRNYNAIPTLKAITASLIYLLLIFTLTACSDGSDNSSRSVAIEITDTPGSLAVGRRTDVMLRDENRNRDITATYWYPTEGANAGPQETVEGAALLAGERQFPLVILIHGLSGNAPRTWADLGPHLASHGYLVMAPSTGSNFLVRDDIINHPGDASFLIDTALGVNTADEMFVGRVESGDIAVGGLSFGGLATYLLAYDEQYQDARVKGVIFMAPAISDARPVNTRLSQLILHGTDDFTIPFDSSLNFYEAAAPTKYFVALQGGSHAGFSAGADDRFQTGTMEVLRTRSITRATVLAFTTSLFADEAGDREVGELFLQHTLDAENGDINVMFEK